MATTNEDTYLSALKYILENGEKRVDRTGVGTLSVFGMQNRYDLSKTFPILTGKRVPFKSVLSELLWFMEGSGDERRLAEIHYGKPRSELSDKTTIWTANAQAPYWKDKAKFEGDLGRVYGVQFRSWRTPDGKTIDQVEKLIAGLKENPNDRRHILTAWNPGEIDQMGLPPCHITSQFNVSQNRLSCHLTQRSADYFLGVPFNIASYALLTHMIARLCGLEVGEFVHTTVDSHIYLDHLDAVDEMLYRQPREGPRLIIEGNQDTIDDFKMENFRLEGYDPLPAIKAPMAV